MQPVGVEKEPDRAAVQLVGYTQPRVLSGGCSGRSSPIPYVPHWQGFGNQNGAGGNEHPNISPPHFPGWWQREGPKEQQKHL